MSFQHRIYNTTVHNNTSSVLKVSSNTSNSKIVKMILCNVFKVNRCTLGNQKIISMIIRVATDLVLMTCAEKNVNFNI